MTTACAASADDEPTWAPGMRFLPCLTRAVVRRNWGPVLAQAPRSGYPATRTRAGNKSGAAISTPMSDQAGNVGPADTNAPVAPRLPSPEAWDDASVHALLLAARAARTTGRTGDVQKALERAETRAPDRSVPPLQTGVRGQSRVVATIRDTLYARGTGERPATARLPDEAIVHGTRQTR